MMQQIIERSEATITKLEKLGFPRVDMRFEIKTLPRGTAGTAKCLSNIVSISKDYLSTHPEEVLRQTVPHEIVHIYVARYFPNYKQAHGKEFRQLMRLIGCGPRTYHSMGVAPSPRKVRNTFTYKCGCSTFQLGGIRHKKAQAGAKYRCGGCHQLVAHVKD